MEGSIESNKDRVHWESEGPLKAVWVGGLQINGLVHEETFEN